MIRNRASTKETRDRAITGNFWYGIVPVTLYLLFFFLIPLVYVLMASFQSAGATGGGLLDYTWNLDNYISIFTAQHNLIAYWRSLYISFISVFVGILLAYPITYTIVFKIKEKYQKPLLLAIIAPFWTSFIVRAFSWQLFLAKSGPLSSFLMKVGILNEPLGILYTHAATIIGLALFSTMIITLNLYSTMDGIDMSLLEAVADLGGKKWAELTEVIFPLSLPGLVLGSILSFIICIGNYVAPTLLGGGVKSVMAQLMVDTLQINFNVPMASAYSVLMILTIFIVVLPFFKYIRRGRTGE